MNGSILIAAGGLLLLALFTSQVGKTEQARSISSIKVWAEVAESRGQVVEIGTMTAPRAAQTATLLSSDQVLIAGGCEARNCEGRSAVAELYSPDSNSFTRVGDMLTARVSHTATLLPDGRVLIVGGLGPNGVIATAELYEPTTRTFSRTRSMLTARHGHIATLLQDGRVLIVGGADGSQSPLATTEVYDPKTGLFTLAGRMRVPRVSHVATLLPDGRVLVTGGHSRRRGPVLASAEIFDAVTGEFSGTGDMTVPRHKHAAVAMQDGKVLVVGGSDARDWRGKYASAEVFDPSKGAFSHIADMQEERFKLRSAVVVLQTGEVLVGGGAEHVEIYDPVSKAFQTAGGSVGTSRMFATATLLSTGNVFIAGGYDGRIRPAANAWMYHP